VADVAAKFKVTGGKKAEAIIKSIGKKLGQQHVRVGFLESAKYPAFRTQGTGAQRKTRPVKVLPVAQVAFWQEFGTMRNGRQFVPPRPFFRNMIAKKSPRWGVAVGQILKGADYDETLTLGRMGELIQGQLQQEIIDTNAPPNAPFTVWMKNGASKVLVDQGIMLGAVAPGVKASEVKEGLTE